MSEKETTTAAERKVEWETIKTLLPRDKTPEDKQRRLELFKRFDKDGSGSLTFDETYKACVNVLHLNKFTSRLRDITKRAYNKAKSMGTKDRNEGSEDEVEFLEFRLMLCYIYDYFELTVMFDEIDTDGSMMIDMDEFKAAVPKMKEWGLTISNPVKTFNEIDDNGSGKMTFDEFCTWAVEKRMDREGDPDKAAKVAEALATPVQSRSANIPEMPRVKNLQAAFGKSAEDRKQAWLATRHLLPTEKTPEQKKQRVELFDEFDKQKSGALTYDEVYKGCVNVLHLNEVTTRLRDVTKRAYNKACGMGNQERSQGDDDLVEFLEFRLMLCYLRDYFDLTVLFNDIDTSGDGLVDADEFKVAAQKVTEYGLPIDDPEKTFNEIDDNGSGQISFDEFAAWAAAKKLEQDGDPDGGAPAQPRSLEAGSSAQPKAGRFRQAAEDATPEEKKEAWKAARALIPTEKTPEQKQQRIELFYKFDKDGSNSLNFDEVYKGCVNVLGLHKITTHLRDITKRAFNQSRTMGNQERGQGDEDLVEFLEFRLLMCYIADYFDLSALFDEMDTSGDHLVSKDEFMAALPKVEAWGLKIEDPEATFNALDDNASGEITFEEFCAWATAQKIERNGDPDGGAREAPPPQPPKKRALPGETTATQRKVEWDRIRELIPRKKTPEDKQRRIDLFAKFDKDGSGSLTFDETYKGCVNVLHLNKFTNRLRDITKRAYNKAKSLGTEDRGAGSADEVEFLEFRLMLCYIYDYFELTVMFDEIDADGSMMIDKDEFMSAIPKMREWGLDISDPEGTYAALDGNGSGKVTFDEFCAWAVDKKMDVDGDPDNIH